MQQTRNRKEKGNEEKKRKLKKERWNNRKERDRENKMIQNDNNWIKWTDNDIGDEGARMISEALKTNTTLTTLHLGCDENEVKWKQPKTTK